MIEIIVIEDDVLSQLVALKNGMQREPGGLRPFMLKEVEHAGRVQLFSLRSTTILTT